MRYISCFLRELLPNSIPNPSIIFLHMCFRKLHHAQLLHNSRGATVRRPCFAGGEMHFSCNCTTTTTLKSVCVPWRAHRSSSRTRDISPVISRSVSKKSELFTLRCSFFVLFSFFAVKNCLKTPLHVCPPRPPCYTTSESSCHAS